MADRNMRPLVLATRGSALALKQAEIVKSLIEQKMSRPVELSIVRTHGDRDQSHSLVSIGGKGLFVRAIEEELIAGRADIAVHSGKDLPYELACGLTIAGVPKAADCRDVLLFHKKHTIESLRKMSHPVIGTGSPRRRMELMKMFPHAQFRENRGNIPTRIRKLREGQFDAIVLAQAGLDRLPMDLHDLTVYPLSVEECLPAACQGILAVECRQEDKEIVDMLKDISDADSLLRFQLERELFISMKADCSMAVGVHAELLLPSDHGERGIVLTAMYEGKKASIQGSLSDAPALCRSLVRDVIPEKHQ